jgi:Holliday junction DNA helicase RuvB
VSEKVGAAAAKLLTLVNRYGADAYTWLSKIKRSWEEYISTVKCGACGSTNIRWIDDYSYECENGHRGKVLGLEAWELGAPAWFMRVMNDMGLVDVLYKSRSTTTYGIPRATLEAINRVLRVQVEPETGVATPAPIVEEVKPITVEEFSEIVGYDDVKQLIVKALNSPKPVHILLVGPPASAKTMFLEVIARHYNVPILVAGTSTGAGIRDFIATYIPRVLVIDELDKRRDPQDLSVLLTWMESQRIVITMASRREILGKPIECPYKEGCRVVAAANTLEGIPEELLSRFLKIEFEEYKEDEVKKICTEILTRREGVAKEFAEKVAEAVVKELGSKDPRDCIKLARLATNEEELKTVVETLKKRKPKKKQKAYMHQVKH